MVLDKISKSYGDNIVFKDFSYVFPDGKITVVLGESGCGKTTLLHIIAGLIDYTGTVEKVECSMVFQEDRLIPNLTIADNIKLINPNVDISEILDKFCLDSKENSYPRELSAGMARRVAIARAMSFDKPVLLMDEPYRNLDYSLKYKMMALLKAYHKEKKNTVIMVTHNLDEAVFVADRIVIMGESGITKEINKITKNTRDQILEFLINKEKPCRVK